MIEVFLILTFISGNNQTIPMKNEEKCMQAMYTIDYDDLEEQVSTVSCEVEFIYD